MDGRACAALALVALLGACADPPAATQPINPYVGTRWVLSPGGGHAPTIEFSETRASGFAGCNRWFSQVSADGATLRFSAIGITRRICDPPVMAAERDFMGRLEAAQTAVQDGELLVLRGERGAELARFRRER